MKHEELDLEKRCRAWARANGWVAWKNEKNGCKGIPDDSFLSPDGNTFLLVEFKKDARQRLRPEQETWRQRYPNVIFVIYSFDDFKALLASKSSQNAPK